MHDSKKRSPLAGLIILILILALVSALVAATGGMGKIRAFINRARAYSNISDEDIREAFLEISEKNPEAQAYLDGFDGVTDYDLTLDLSDELAEGEIPYFTQWDSRWGYCRYGSGLMGWTGCGPTALSMVAMGLTGDGTLTPAYIADFAIREGYCVAGNGTAWLLFSEGAEKLGLTAKEIPLWEPTMRGELEAGNPMICIMGAGHFTETGHYIVLTGCDDDGFQVYDPYRPSNCKTWSYEDIQGEIRNMWAYQV